MKSPPPFVKGPPKAPRPPGEGRGGVLYPPPLYPSPSTTIPRAPWPSVTAGALTDRSLAFRAAGLRRVCTLMGVRKPLPPLMKVHPGLELVAQFVGSQGWTSIRVGVEFFCLFPCKFSLFGGLNSIWTFLGGVSGCGLLYRHGLGI